MNIQFPKEKKHLNACTTITIYGYGTSSMAIFKTNVMLKKSLHMFSKMFGSAIKSFLQKIDN